MADNVKQVAKSAEVDERLAALLSNAGAIRSVASAIEGTLGPKGLNCMLVDRFGDVIVTNDGSAILEHIDVTHPASKMLIRTAKAQEEEVGDGTTTATILASALITEGVSHISRGVPVTKVLEGIRLGVAKALEFIQAQAKQIESPDDQLIWRTAYISGREQADVADLVVRAAQFTGKETLLDPAFRLSNCVIAKEGAENEVFTGLIVDKARMSRQMPNNIQNAKILVIDDALEPEQFEDEALATESGFSQYVALQNEFRENLRKIIDIGVNVVFAAKGISDAAEEVLTDASVLAVRRIASKDIAALIEHTGAKTIKRAGLKKSLVELAAFLGTAEKVYEDERLEHIRILGGGGKPVATILVGASTREVKDERERIAKDATAAVQAAVAGGIVAGGGAIEIGAVREIQRLRETVRGMAAYGVDCVAEALKKPLMQIASNAGFNPLEKVEDVIAAQAKTGTSSLAIDCDTGEVTDMMAVGVVDPALVKIHALKAAAEVADAILRINVIIRRRDGATAQDGAGQLPTQ